jgi:hypothetical protein
LTVLYGQTGTDKICYSKPELQKIASKLVKANECDTLLTIAYKRINILDNTVFKLESQTQYKDSINFMKDSIISIHKVEIKELKSDLKSEKNRHTLTKVGWGSTSLGLIGVIIKLFFF